MVVVSPTFTSGGPQTPESKRVNRQSMSEASPAATWASRGSNDPIRPSIDARSRRSSDGSGENGTGNGKDSPPHNKEEDPAQFQSTVYKGARRRRKSVSVRDPVEEGTASDEESDAEDSETPWTCTLHVGLANVGAMSHGRVSSSGSQAWVGGGAGFGKVGEGEETALKIKLGTMTPAPHHPKVVSQLKMPFPIPHVNVDRCVAVQHDELHSVSKGDLVLTMEEIKDIVCVTGLWLVVREGFGGLERRRKGDGWRIRG